jgi:hypothetical protein
MVGLPQGFLNHADKMDADVLRKVLKDHMFEIENSIAMYHLLQKLHTRDNQPSTWDNVFRDGLDQIRERFGKPVALLAVTEPKYRAMKESEFGKAPDQPLPSDEVRRLTGFDNFFGPEDYVRYLQEHGESPILFVRSSDPVDKLKKPKVKDREGNFVDNVVDNPLLQDPNLRRIIKAHSITFNIDRPGARPGAIDTINDTKKYLPMQGMAHRVDRLEDAWTTHEVAKGKPPIVTLNPDLQAYLSTRGIDHRDVISGEVELRFKPMDVSYGCYGHVSTQVSRGKDRQEVKTNLEQRGAYIVQPELRTPTIINAKTGQEFTYIDRNFFATDDGENIRFMGGFRSLMPVDTVEAKQKRVHGNGSTVWAEVY